jgi:hypothetical protein
VVFWYPDYENCHEGKTQKLVPKNLLTRHGQFCKIASKLNPFQQGIKNQPKNFKCELEQEPVLLRDLMRI